MTYARAAALASAASALLLAGPASAWTHHRRHVPHVVQPVRSEAYPYPSYAGGWQAEAIARATREMQDAPGLTNELAPDAKETATGGPSGGVPGFSGH